MNTLTYLAKTGASISELVPSLAELRIEVFHDYPYLYEGDLEYEREYLKTYLDADKSLVFAVFDNDKMVGATTCIPLVDETDDVRKPFIEKGMDISKIFYFGESILLTPYRGLGLGHRFFDVREAHAASFGLYQTTCFCSVSRPDTHPLRPEAYRSNDSFWHKRGYRPVPALESYFEWTDLGEPLPTRKPMIYWLRPLQEMSISGGSRETS